MSVHDRVRVLSLDPWTTFFGEIASSLQSMQCREHDTTNNMVQAHITRLEGYLTVQLAIAFTLQSLGGSDADVVRLIIVENQSGQTHKLKNGNSLKCPKNQIMITHTVKGKV